jgi:pimeloyl-ACP methyl ester carboxylesterase
MSLNLFSYFKKRMKRAFSFLLFFFCLLFVGMHNAYAASQDAGTLNGIDSTSQIQTGVGSTGDYIQQFVTSTFTGYVSTVSVVANRVGTGSSSPLFLLFDNVTSSTESDATYYFANTCDDSHDVTFVTSTECVVTFTLSSPIYVNAGDRVRMQFYVWHQCCGNSAAYYLSFRPRTSDFSSAIFHSGSFTDNWDNMWSPFLEHQVAWAWNFNPTTSGGSALCPENYCNDNILFLPGTEGSRLYGSGGRLWEPLSDGNVQQLYMNSAGLSFREDIHTKDVIDQAYASSSGPNIYKSFLNDLESRRDAEHSIAAYAIAPYDWRLSPDEIVTHGNQLSEGYISYDSFFGSTSTPYIIEQLRTLAQTSRTGKVTIVAHSYGGLVAKALMKYIQDNDIQGVDGSLISKIDNLVLVGVPQTGTPQAIGATLHGYDLGFTNEDGSFILMSDEVGRTFASTSAMSYNLLPSDAYFDGDGSGITTAPITFINGTATKLYTDYYGNEVTSTDALYAFLLGYEGRPQAASDDLYSPSILSNASTVEAENIHYGLDHWVAPTSTSVYQIAGWGEDTLAQIQYYDASGTLEYLPRIALDGDGTVIIPSALAMSTTTSNITRWWLNLRGFNDGVASSSRKNHKDLFEVPALRDFIINNIVAHSTTTLPQFITTDQPYFNPNEKHLHFFLHSPLALSARNSQGNEISATTSTLPGAIYRRFGEVQYISVPASSTPSLLLDGYASGSFTLDLEEVSGDTTVSSSRFSAISSVTSTEAFMSFPDGTIAHASPLSIDKDRNGTVDAFLLAKPVSPDKQTELKK